MFRKEFPRMYELRDQIETAESLNVFWRNFNVSLQEVCWREACRPYEDALQSLDSASWEFLKREASVQLTKWDKKNGRGQQQLIDIINQARAYRFLLREIGCSNIKFIPRSNIKDVKTPDLEGTLREIKVICEVKTINISNYEITRRCRHDTVRNKYIPLEQGFFVKLTDKIEQAKEQIKANMEGKDARHIVYIIINFDEYWGEHKEEYFQEIDQYLGKKGFNGIEIVFHNQPVGFPMHITMKFATVVNEADCVTDQKDS